jgi:hypothetical protein
MAGRPVFHNVVRERKSLREREREGHGAREREKFESSS